MIVKNLKGLFLVLVLAPFFGGYYLVGIPKFLRQPQNHYMLWVTAIINMILLFLAGVMLKAQNKKAKVVILSIAAISYLFGVGCALFLAMHGKDLLKDMP